MDKSGFSGSESVALLRRTDDFSEQFSIEGDPKFWIRIELPFTEKVVVSDLLFGNLDEYQMANALSQAMHLIGVRRPSEIVFKDLGEVDEQLTADTVQRVQRVIEALVMRQRRFIVARDFDIRRRKVDLVVTFKNFD